MFEYILLAMSLTLILYALGQVIINIIDKTIKPIHCLALSVCFILAVTLHNDIEIKELKQRIIVLESKQVK